MVSLALKYAASEEMGNRDAARGIRSVRKCEIAGDARYAVKYTRAKASIFLFFFSAKSGKNGS